MLKESECLLETQVDVLYSYCLRITFLNTETGKSSLEFLKKIYHFQIVFLLKKRQILKTLKLEGHRLQNIHILYNAEKQY